MSCMKLFFFEAGRKYISDKKKFIEVYFDLDIKV